MSFKSHPLWLWFRRIGPWVTALVLVTYVLYAVSLHRVWESVQAAGPAGVLALGLVYFLYIYAADVLATWATFRWFCGALRLRDVAMIRGATYLLAIVNYNLGQGGIAYFVGKRLGLGLVRATGVVLLTMGVLFVCLLVFASVGGLFAPAVDARIHTIRAIAAAGLVAFVLYLGVIALRPAFLARREVLRPLFDTGVVGHLKATLVRVPQVVGHLVFQWLLLQRFGVDLPFSAAATLLPAVAVIGSIPVTIQGLGTQQAAAMELLGGYALAGETIGRAQVVAFSLVGTAMFIVYGSIMGLLCLRNTIIRSDLDNITRVETGVRPLG
jgi:hypothetical protein